MKKMGLWHLILVPFLIMLNGAAGLAEAGDTQWPLFGGSYGGSQYSPLDQITTKNVDDLEVAWVHHSGDLIVAKDKRFSTGYEVHPIHANGSIYYCTPLNRIFSLDPATGKEKWVFDPHAVQEETGEPLITQKKFPAYCRGVSYWEAKEKVAGEPCQKRIFRNDNYGHLFAVDADTGKACKDFGAAKGHPGYVTNWDYNVNGSDNYRGTATPPGVVGDLVIGASGANDSNANANDGIVRAYDVRTGDMVWDFNPIPEQYRDQTGAGNVWAPIVADEKNGLVFLPTTSPSPDYFGGTRAEMDMPLTSALVAVDAKTGAVKWSFQTVHHDVFDYDNGAHPLLVTIQKDGKPRDVAILQTKMGWVFVFDRVTGEAIWPIEEVPVPQSTVPGEKTSPTQPVPQGIEPFALQGVTREDMWGLTPFDKAWCEDKFDTLHYKGMYTPPSKKGAIASPGPFGGGNWGGASYDPTTNQLIVKSQNLPMILTLTPQNEMPEETASTFSSRPLVGTNYYFQGEVFLSPLGIPCGKPAWGTLTALDMDTGKKNWQVPLGQARRFGVNLPEFLGWGSANVGGPITTAGGLTFIAATMDEKIRAFDTKTGEILWSDGLPAAGPSVPMTYMAGGRQFVVTTAGGVARLYDNLSDALVAYALPK
ncbi:pyrroloquinoline quinone-dependent dehydrogenase [Kordiimonas pumila]|uniref:Pyrroloquinoline quinone-dependent dehydrogenase n=1 Tax=Kordiimonas pumila TaxID=2161677 RepID=A0ABV7D874_9PROT|nr:pyrroloquinoline quinone-dependent dehydrogenase [Kordiimonas pumila]